MRLISVLVLILLTATASLAQPGHGRRAKLSPEDRSALRAEITAYLEANVLPVIAPAREQFDAQLSAEEQQTLAETRVALQAMRAQRGPKHGERPSREARDAHQEAMAALLDPVHDMAAVHAVALRTLFKDLRPQAETWREDLHQIMARYRPERESHSDEAPTHRRPHHGPHGHGRGGPLGRMLRPVGFLLWTPDQPLMSELEPAAEVALYPNPATQQATLALDLKTAGEVQVQVIDRNGKVYQSLPAQQWQAGSQQLTLDLQDLEPGVYLIRVNTPDGQVVKKLMVEE